MSPKPIVQRRLRIHYSGESIFSFLPARFAARCEFAAAAHRSSPRKMQHGVPQQPIRLGLVTATIGFEPCDHVGIEPHRDGLLGRPVELSDFGAAPIENRRSIRKINVYVSLYGDRAYVSPLIFRKFPHRPSFREPVPFKPRGRRSHSQSIDRIS